MPVAVTIAQIVRSLRILVGVHPSEMSKSAASSMGCHRCERHPKNPTADDFVTRPFCSFLQYPQRIGTDRRRDLARTVAVIAEIGADVLALQEADTRFGTRTGLLDLESIRLACGSGAGAFGQTRRP